MFPATFVSRSKMVDDIDGDCYTKIEKAYNAGMPFFTKAAIREAVRAIDSIVLDGRSDETVPITGIDGATVSFRLRMGEIISGSSTFILKQPLLCYHPIEMMMGLIEPCGACSPSAHDHECACLPMAVCHEADKIDRSTKEIIHYFPISPKLKIQVEFLAYHDKWRASEGFDGLKSIFEGQDGAVKVPHGVNKVVAFGLGSLAWWGQRENSASQHALVLSVRDFLQARGLGKVACYAQDPDYQAVDKEILNLSGITVLDDPRAFLEVDETSVVVSIHPGLPVRQVVADIARPAVMIWHRDTYKQLGPQKADPTSPRVEQMLEKHYVEVEWDFDHKLFGDTAVYVRKI
ncbi:hypothetical protein C8A03DRAFT_18590 [Achaetomium macrosporum]|uniref:SRR1-like domain-containing protein n=1 Tax=Achaetomium macrosporum TaxID=79813 RepID=A0AAN7H8M2_9PEZI|nr:hypothetical protein C8A03DRAFT_18590 [Achaetomium macrosporum]